MCIRDRNENALKQLVSDNTQPGCSGGSLSSSSTGSALCQHCNVPANDTDSLLCDICGGTFHAKCASITDDVRLFFHYLTSLIFIRLK